MKFDLQRFASGEILAHHGGQDYAFTIASSGVNYPRLAVRNNSTNFYAALSSEADTPRLAVKTSDDTKYIPLTLAGNGELVSWLKFDESETKDECGNIWTVVGTPTLDTTTKKFGNSSLHCPDGACLKTSNLFALSESKWTFDCWVNYHVIDKGNNGIVALGAPQNGGIIRHGVIIWDKYAGVSDARGKNWLCEAYTENNFPAAFDVWTHVAITKRHSTITFFENGQAIVTHQLGEIPKDSGWFWIGGTQYGTYTDVHIDNVRFFKGKALWTSDFTPPTAADYI